MKRLAEKFSYIRSSGNKENDREKRLSKASISQPTEFEGNGKTLEVADNAESSDGAAASAGVSPEDITLKEILEIQQNLDRDPVLKLKNPSKVTAEFKNIDLAERPSLLQGPLKFKAGPMDKRKEIALHCILYDDVLVLLQKQDDRYTLKCYGNQSDKTSGTVHDPFLPTDKLIVRSIATDKRAFFAMYTSDVGPIMYEFVASSVALKKQWMEIITETTKKRESVLSTSHQRKGFVVPGSSRNEEEKPLEEESTKAKVDHDQPIKHEDIGKASDVVDNVGSSAGPGIMMKCIVVQKDENGYGFTVNGGSPVYIQSIKQDGPAARAGVLPGDKIMKINGMIVKDRNHLKVAKLIKAESSVALTLLGALPKTSSAVVASRLPDEQNPNEATSTPQPQKKHHAFHDEKVETIKKMLEQETAEIKRVEEEYARNPEPKILRELGLAKKLKQDLEKQLKKAESMKESCLEKSALSASHCSEGEGSTDASEDRKASAGSVAPDGAEADVVTFGVEPEELQKVVDKENNIQNASTSKSGSIQNKFTTFSSDELLCVSDDVGRIGRGAFGVVRLAFHEIHNAVALKCIETFGGFKKEKFMEQKIKKELECLQIASHENVVRVYGLAQWSNVIAIVMEYLPGGNLMDLIEDEDVELSPFMQLRMCAEVANGLSFIHNLSKQRRLVHGDVKAENILLTNDLHCKISDFGSAIISSHTGTLTSTSAEMQKKIQFSEIYSPPEFIKEPLKNRGPSYDVYSYSILVFIVLGRELPVQHVALEHYKEAISQGHRPDLENIMNRKRSIEGRFRSDKIKSTDTLISVMKDCWKQKPSSRPTMIKVKQKLFKIFNEIPVEHVLENITHAIASIKIQIPSKDQYNCIPSNYLQPFNFNDQQPSENDTLYSSTSMSVP